MEKSLVRNWEFIVEMMDDEIREAVHALYAPCGRLEFLYEYCIRHNEKFDEDFLDILDDDIREEVYAFHEMRCYHDNI